MARRSCPPGTSLRSSCPEEPAPRQLPRRVMSSESRYGELVRIDLKSERCATARIASSAFFIRASGGCLQTTDRRHFAAERPQSRPGPKGRGPSGLSASDGRSPSIDRRPTGAQPTEASTDLSSTQKVRASAGTPSLRSWPRRQQAPPLRHRRRAAPPPRRVSAARAPGPVDQPGTRPAAPGHPAVLLSPRHVPGSR